MHHRGDMKNAPGVSRGKRRRNMVKRNHFDGSTFARMCQVWYTCRADYTN